MLEAVTYALTEIQPWGTAVVHFGKDIENRIWPPHQRVIGTRIAIHAGQKRDGKALDDLVAKGLLPKEMTRADVPVSALLGTVRVLGYVLTNAGHGRLTAKEHKGLSDAQVEQALRSPWLQRGSYGWLLSEPRALPTPIPCPGARQLWRVPEPLQAALAKAA